MMICIKSLYKSYDVKSVLKGVDLKVNKGEILGFIGENGAGKTTTIKSLVGLLKPDSGEIEINGYNSGEKEYRQSFGYVADEPFLYEALTGEEYLLFLSQLWDEPGYKDRTMELLDKFKLLDSYKVKIKGYSFGMKKKLAIAGALIHKPKCLILDEPLNGLDPTSAFIAKEFFKEYSKNGNTVFFSTHTLDVAERVCDRIAILKNGVIFDCDTTENLLKNDSKTLENYFMEVVKDV
ncbi:MAG: ABC transporter ATP-binding protein [Clostridiaceae bacterium]